MGVPEDALEEEIICEQMDDGVVDSWDQIDVEEMPVPVKVKKEMRKEEKKRKKDLEKAAKAQDNETNEAITAEPVAPIESDTHTEAVLESFNNCSISDPVSEESIRVAPVHHEEVSSGPSEAKTLSIEEKAAVKADREAKKAAKAAQRAAAKQKKNRVYNFE